MDGGVGESDVCGCAAHAVPASDSATTLAKLSHARWRL